MNFFFIPSSLHCPQGQQRLLIQLSTTHPPLTTVSTAGAVPSISAATHMSVVGGGPPGARGRPNRVRFDSPLRHLPGWLPGAMPRQRRHLVASHRLSRRPTGRVGVGASHSGGGALLTHLLLVQLRVVDLLLFPLRCHLLIRRIVGRHSLHLCRTSTVTMMLINKYCIS